VIKIMTTTPAKQIPQDIHMEKVVLCSMILSEKCQYQGTELLITDDFYPTLHKQVFESIKELVSTGKPVDIATVSSKLAAKNSVYQDKSEAIISEIIEFDDIATTADISNHIKILRDHRLNREIITLSQKMNSSAFKNVEPEKILAAVDNHLRSLNDGEGNKGTQKISELVGPCMEVMEEASEKKGLIGIDTGLTELNSYTGGAMPSDLIVIAGRPGSGKTSLALTFMINAWELDQAPSLIFSMEMAKLQLTQRLISMKSGVSIHKLRSGRLSTHERELVAIAAGEVYNMSFFINDMNSITPAKIRSITRRHVEDYGVKQVFVDYLQLMGGGSENRNLEIGAFSRAFKIIAKDFNIPFYELSQLSRAMESGQSIRMPRLSDLRESGAIEQDADVVLFTFRPVLYDKTACSTDANIIIGKQRNGPVGPLDVSFLGSSTRFVDKFDVDDVPDFPDDHRPGPGMD
jgi:replicative DNA helicase